jgi:1-acyl-sn-glycerol-3-phosphate acyltransferase
MNPDPFTMEVDLGMAAARIEATPGLLDARDACGIVGCAAKWTRGLARIVATVVEARRRGVSHCPLEGARHLSGACRRLAEIMGVEVVIHGQPPAEGLVVANHLGFLDIVALSAAAPCVFVAKREVGRWPLVGSAASQCGTVFVDRERRSAVATVAGRMRRILEAGGRVVVFPEGTSTDGTAVLPFRPALLQSAVDARAALIPCGIAYRDPAGAPLSEMAYFGERSLGAALSALVARRRTRVHLVFGSPIRAEAPRAELARELHRKVTRLMATV